MFFSNALLLKIAPGADALAPARKVLSPPYRVPLDLTETNYPAMHVFILLFCATPFAHVCLFLSEEFIVCFVPSLSLRDADFRHDAHCQPAILLRS